jgi:hypothetical protein
MTQPACPAGAHPQCGPVRAAAVEILGFGLNRAAEERFPASILSPSLSF